MFFLGQNKRIFEVFERVAGQRYREHAKATHLTHGGVLWVKVDAPIYMERFNYLKAAWIREINIEMGDRMVTSIKFRVGAMGDAPPPVEGYPRGSQGPPDEEEGMEDESLWDRQPY
jgi:hypothetical protein